MYSFKKRIRQLGCMVIVTAMMAVLAFPAVVAGAPADINGWKNEDIGSVGKKAEIKYDDGKFTIKASGSDIWMTEDGFNFTYKTLSGDGEITAKIEYFDYADPWTKVGLMMREDNSAGSRFADLIMAPPGTLMQCRKAVGMNAESMGGYDIEPDDPYWLKLVRKGNKFSGYNSPDGEGWRLVHEFEMDMKKELIVGLAFTAHDNTSTATAIFSNASIKQGVSDVKIAGKINNGGAAPSTEKPPVINPVKAKTPLKYSRSWVGNSAGATKEKWMQNYVEQMVVIPDGTVYTTSGWDEAGRRWGIYKDGDIIGNKDMKVNGRAVKDKNGYVWEISGTKIVKVKMSKDDLVKWSFEGSPYALKSQARIGVNRVEYSSARRESTGVSINDAGVPTGLAIANDGKLMVADNGPRQQILFYDITKNPPKLVSTFGQKGGITSGTPGVMHPTKFFTLSGTGMDSKGNIYVSMSADGIGSCLRKLTPSGNLIWEHYSPLFVDQCDFDPTTDGKDIYGAEEHFVMDYSKTKAGSEFKWHAFTLDPIKYPHDPRIYLSGGQQHGVTSPWISYINGKKFMYLSGMFNGFLAIYRFDGEIAVPSAFIAPSKVGRVNGKEQWAPNQPRKGRWLWRDLNGDGDQQDNEFYGADGKNDRAINGWDVDSKGNIWIAYAYGKIEKYECQGLDKIGNPIYTRENVVSYSVPKEANFHQLRRAEYIAEADTMYLGGYSYKNYEYDGGGSIGSEIIRFDNWSKKPEMHKGFPILIPNTSQGKYYTSVHGQSMSVSGKRIFVTYANLAPDGSKVGVNFAYNAETGEFLGQFNPGPEVGGADNAGWVDIPYGQKSFMRANGEYLVLVEEDWKGKNFLYRMPSNDGKK